MNRKNKRPPSTFRRLATENRLLEVAARLFRERGFHGTSMGLLANKMRLRKASIYYYIKGKQEILFRLMEERLVSLADRVRRIAESELPPIEKLRQAIKLHLLSLTENPNKAFVFLHEFRFLRSEKLKKEYVAKRDEYEYLFRNIISEGIEKGEFRKVDPKLFTFGVLGMLNWTLQWYRPDGPYSAEGIADCFFNIIMQSLEVSEG